MNSLLYVLRCFQNGGKMYEVHMHLIWEFWEIRILIVSRMVPNIRNQKAKAKALQHILVSISGIWGHRHLTSPSKGFTNVEEKPEWKQLGSYALRAWTLNNIKYWIVKKRTRTLWFLQTLWLDKTEDGLILFVLVAYSSWQLFLSPIIFLALDFACSVFFCHL